MQHCNMYIKAFYSLCLASVLLLLWCLIVSFFLYNVWHFFSRVAEMDQFLCLVFDVPAFFLL